MAEPAPMALLIAGSLFALPGHAIVYCTATGAGSCGLNTFEVAGDWTVVGASVTQTGSGYASLVTGALGGHASVADNTPAGQLPGASYNQYGAQILADFRISGPAAAHVPVHILFSGHGSISGNCTVCEGSASFRHQLDSVSFSGLHFESSGARTLVSPWQTNATHYNSSAYDLGATLNFSPLGTDAFGGTLTFDAASVLGHTFRYTAEISGYARFTGTNPDGAYLISDSSNTALFNVILPQGYSLIANPSNVPLLTQPILLAVPEPGDAWLLGAGLALLVVRIRHRAGA